MSITNSLQSSATPTAGVLEENNNSTLNTTEKVVKLTQSDEVKLHIFVPFSKGDKIRKILGKFEAGNIGEYSRCSFSTKGTGYWRDPKTGKMTHALEERIETVVRRQSLPQLIEALKKEHGYIEMGYDIMPIYARL